MTVKILSFVLSIIFICFICGLLAGCDSQPVDPKNCFHKMATVENLLTQDKFRHSDCVQVGGILVREPTDKVGNAYRLYGDRESIPNGPWVRVFSEGDWTAHGYIYVKGEWRVDDSGYALIAHAYFFPLWKR